jgi:hypothetical protein
MRLADQRDSVAIAKAPPRYAHSRLPARISGRSLASEPLPAQSSCRTALRVPYGRSIRLAGRGRMCSGHQNQRPRRAAMDGVIKVGDPGSLVDPYRTVVLLDLGNRRPMHRYSLVGQHRCHLGCAGCRNFLSGRASATRVGTVDRRALACGRSTTISTPRLRVRR